MCGVQDAYTSTEVMCLITSYKTSLASILWHEQDHLLGLPLFMIVEQHAKRDIFLYVRPLLLKSCSIILRISEAKARFFVRVSLRESESKRFCCCFFYLERKASPNPLHIFPLLLSPSASISFDLLIPMTRTRSWPNANLGCFLTIELYVWQMTSELPPPPKNHQEIYRDGSTFQTFLKHGLKKTGIFNASRKFST